MPDWRAYARRAAKNAGFDPDVFERQIQQESGFNPNAVSPAGARGIAQIMPDTARGWGVDPMDPRAALDAAARNMARYTKQYGSIRNALIAYNAGPGRVGKPLYEETRKYIDIILGAGGGSPTSTSTRQPSAPGGNERTLRLQQQAAPPPPPLPNYFQQIANMSPVTIPSVQQNLSPGMQHLQQMQKTNWELMGKLQEQMNNARQSVSRGAADSETMETLRNSPASVMAMFEEAERIDQARVPYKWGGGHDRARGPDDDVVALDCSGAVSQVLGIDPRTSGAFMNWGKPGRGRNVTIYAKEGHVLMEINGHLWGTSRSNPGGGAGWIKRSDLPSGYLDGFVARHPRGM